MIIKQEIDQDRELNWLDDRSRDINPYRESRVNYTGKVDTVFFSNRTVVDIQ